jgi:hypothetical protein
MSNWQFLAAPEQGTTDYRDMLYNISGRHVALGNPSSLAFGDGDFTIFWRGWTIQQTGSGSTQAVFAKIGTGTSGSGLYMYFNGTSKQVIVRQNGVDNTYSVPSNYTSGVPFTFVFGRRGGSAANNRLAASYELWVDGVKLTPSVSGSEHASANFDNTYNARLMQHTSGNPTLVGFTSRFGVVKGRMLEAEEITGLDLDIIPSDLQPLYRFEASSGTLVEDTSSLGVNGTVTGWPAGDTDTPATQVVWYRGDTTLLVVSNTTLQTKVIPRSYTFTRVITSTAATTTFSYTVRDTSGTALKAGEFTTSGYRGSVNFSINAGQTLELTVTGTTSQSRAVCFL